MATLNIEDFPDSLHDALRARAESRRHSVAEEATHIVAEALGQSEPVSILGLKGLGRELWSEIDAARLVEQERDAWDRRSTGTDIT